MDDSRENVIPMDLDAEVAFLSCLLLCRGDGVLLGRLLRRLNPSQFFQPDHKLIFEVISEMFGAGQGVDATLLRGELSTRGLLQEISQAYIGQIIAAEFVPEHGMEYADRIAERARERDGIRIGERLANKLRQPRRGNAASESIADAIKSLWEIESGARRIQIKRISQAIEEFVERKVKREEPEHINTGFATLDRDYPGVLALGGYTLVGGRPSMGKSTWVRQLLRLCAGAGITCGLVAVEEREHKISGNYLSAETSIENSHIAYGNWSEHDWNEVGVAMNKMKDLPWWETDQAIKMRDVLGAVEQMATQYRCQVIAVDHIHLIGYTGQDADSREQQLNEMSGELKSAFKQFNVAGVVAAQLSRPVKGINPGPPSLTDLRGSGALEEHADAVLFLHRDDYYERGKSNPQINGLAKVVIAKLRNGSPGEVEMRAELKYQRFVDDAIEATADMF